MRAYVAIARRACRRAFIYPFFVWSQLVGNLIRLGLFLAVWSWLLRADPGLNGTLLYIFAAFFMDALNYARFPWDLPVAIRSGQIAIGLLQPISNPLRLLAEQWGQNAVLLLLAMPVYAAAFYLLAIPQPSPDRLGWFFVTAFIGHLVYMLTNLAAASLAFWAMKGNLVNTVQYVGFSLLSGKAIPLEYLPDRLRWIAEKLPFVAPFHVPSAVLAGKLSGNGIWNAIALQVFWLLVMALLVHLIWTLATRKLVVQGG